MEVLDQRAENFAVSGLSVGTHKIDDMVCKVGVESAGIAIGGSVRSHDVVVSVSNWDGKD